MSDLIDKARGLALEQPSEQGERDKLAVIRALEYYEQQYPKQRKRAARWKNLAVSLWKVVATDDPFRAMAEVSARRGAQVKEMKRVFRVISRRLDDWGGDNDSAYPLCEEIERMLAGLAHRLDDEGEEITKLARRQLAEDSRVLNLTEDEYLVLSYCANGGWDIKPATQTRVVRDLLVRGLLDSRLAPTEAGGQALVLARPHLDQAGSPESGSDNKTPSSREPSPQE